MAAKKKTVTDSEKALATALMGAPEVESYIQGLLPELLAHLLDLARGVVVVEEKLDKDTGEVVPRIYRVPPDRQALQFLIETSVGKAVSRLEITGKDKGPLEIAPWMPVAAARTAGLLPEADADDDVIEAQVSRVPQK